MTHAETLPDAELDDLAELLADLQQENTLLAAQLAALQQDDRDAELVRQIALRFGIEQRLQQELAKVHQLDRQLKRLRGERRP